MYMKFGDNFFQNISIFFITDGGSEIGLSRLTILEEFSKKRLNNLCLAFISSFFYLNFIIYLFYFIPFVSYFLEKFIERKRILFSILFQQ